MLDFIFCWSTSPSLTSTNSVLQTLNSSAINITSSDYTTPYHLHNGFKFISIVHSYTLAAMTDWLAGWLTDWLPRSIVAAFSAKLPLNAHHVCHSNDRIYDIISQLKVYFKFNSSNICLSSNICCCAPFSLHPLSFLLLCSKYKYLNTVFFHFILKLNK